MCSQTKAAAVMANIPRADIDPSGVFKYIVIRVYSREEGDDSEIDIVRGYGWAEYHGEYGDCPKTLCMELNWGHKSRYTDYEISNFSSKNLKFKAVFPVFQNGNSKQTTLKYSNKSF
uniref:14 kDa phosphohistidine phosphatase n=1 Tax=Poecilia reticulata TaxID=8081 RepID=A0A3P9QBQ1_POERE